MLTRDTAGVLSLSLYHVFSFISSSSCYSCSQSLNLFFVLSVRARHMSISLNMLFKVQPHVQYLGNMNLVMDGYNIDMGPSTGITGDEGIYSGLVLQSCGVFVNLQMGCAAVAGEID